MRRLSPIVLLLGLISLPLAAQEAPPPSTTKPDTKTPKPPTPTGRITGTVLCADTHNPARGATVIIAALPSADGKALEGNDREFITHVGMDGTYTADHVAPGEYGVMALLPGYLSPTDELTSEDTSSKLSVTRQRELLTQNGTATVHGSETETFDISLQRGAAVSGRVFYSDGAPATQVSIQIENVNRKAPKSSAFKDNVDAGSLIRSMFMHQSQNTDDQGRFRIAGLKAGTYRIAALQSPVSQGPDTGMEVFSGIAAANPSALHVYAGDALHKTSARTYDLAAGDDLTDVDITIPLDVFHHLRGTLSASDGRPINVADVILTDTTDPTFTFQTNVDHDGSFTFSTVPAGTYNLTSTQSRIMAMGENMNGPISPEVAMQDITAAFADGSQSVIVKNSDILDLKLAVTPIPIPPTLNKPFTDTSEQ